MAYPSLRLALSEVGCLLFPTFSKTQRTRSPEALGTYLLSGGFDDLFTGNPLDTCGVNDPPYARMNAFQPTIVEHIVDRLLGLP
jgi:hypothetical protein